MAGLNSLFNRATFGTRCKTCLSLAVSRIKLLHNRRELQLKNMRKEIAQYLQNGQESIARIKVEHVIREQNISAAYEILELFCEFLIARIPILEVQRDCPFELLEAVASIIFASPRCSDVPELLQVRNLFTTKYGKDFVAAAAELRPDSGVNRAVIEKLSVGAPPVDVRLKFLKEIAREYNLDWNSSSTEKEFGKKHEDLLVCQFMQSPTIDHLKAAKRILRYVKGTLSYGLTFSRSSSTNIIAYSDADWGGDPNSRRSITGSCILLGQNLISWSSKKQATVARSSTESEYRALAFCISDVRWFCYLMRELGIFLCQPPKVLCDNKSTIHITTKSVFHSRTRHIDIDYHFVREILLRKALQIQYVPTHLQLADILTKGLSKDRFQAIVSLFKLSLSPPLRKAVEE